MRTGRMPLANPSAPQYEQTPLLSPAQIAAIITYASSFSNGPQIPTVTTGADLSRGWNLYVNNCAACHGAAAQGGSVGAGINAPNLHGTDQLTIAEAMLVGPGAMPKFTFAQADQDAVVAYVESLNTPAAPGAFPLSGGGPFVEGAVAAVLGVAALIAITMWVARRDKLPETPLPARTLTARAPKARRPRTPAHDASGRAHDASQRTPRRADSWRCVSVRPSSPVWPCSRSTSWAATRASKGRCWPSRWAAWARASSSGRTTSLTPRSWSSSVAARPPRKRRR